MDKKRILIVEDETELREVYVEYLTSLGYEVDSCANGKECLNIALNNNWDLIILDIMIPSLDGISLLRSLKENSETSSKPVIIFSQLDTENLITQCFEAGAEAYLIKSEMTPEKVHEEISVFL